jgi:hypothetical protein
MTIGYAFLFLNAFLIALSRKYFIFNQPYMTRIRSLKYHNPDPDYAKILSEFLTHRPGCLV